MLLIVLFVFPVKLTMTMMTFWDNSLVHARSVGSRAYMLSLLIFLRNWPLEGLKMTMPGYRPPSTSN